MKIKEFYINRYGPLPERRRLRLDDFNLFWGKNEYGKTLTIDALVKILLGGKIKDFKMINRVKEMPEGYVVLEDNKGKELKLPEDGNLSELAGISPSECRSIFIVINSDLSIGSETSFYENITDRLTGLRSGEIKNLKKNLETIGKITPTGAFRNSKEDDKFKTRIDKAESLIQDITGFYDELIEKGFDGFEQRAAKLVSERGRIEEEILRLEDARKREKYEKAKEALNDLKGALKRDSDLYVYNQDDAQLWRDCKKEMQDYKSIREDLALELRETKEEFKNTYEESLRQEKDLHILDDRKRRLDDEIKPQLEDYKRMYKDLERGENKRGFISSIFIVSALLFGLSLIGIIINPSLIFYITSGLFFSLFTVSLIFKWRILRKKGLIKEKLINITMGLSKFGLDSKDLQDIILNIQKFEEKYRKKNIEVQEIRIRKENLDQLISNIQDIKIPKAEKEIGKTEKNIAELKIKSNEESLENYTRKLKSKLEVIGLIEREKSILATLFKTKGDNLEDNIEFWEKETGGLESYKEKARGSKNDELLSTELKVKERELEEEYKELCGSMKVTQDKLKNVERRVNEILIYEDERMLCETSVDLKAVKDKLGGFIEESNKNRDDVLEIISIFEEIEKEEKEKVSELFGKESPVTKHFNEITGGFYTEVIFNREEDAVEVRRKDGKILEAGKLSGGAYDQLYFAIRVALGEMLLKGNRGFFIMDDPFIKADPDRLKRQMDLLMNISGSGWQVIYFSSKGEVKDILGKNISKGAVNYIEIKDMLL